MLPVSLQVPRVRPPSPLSLHMCRRLAVSYWHVWWCVDYSCHTNRNVAVSSRLLCLCAVHIKPRCQ